MADPKLDLYIVIPVT